MIYNFMNVSSNRVVKMIGGNISTVCPKMKKFLIFFYLMGHSPISRLASDRRRFQRKNHKIIQRIPATGFFMLMTYLFLLGLYIHYKAIQESEEVPNIIMSNLYLTVEYITDGIIFSQCLFHGKSLQSAVNSLHFLKEYFHMKFNHELKFDAYYQRTSRGMLFSGLVYLGGTIIYTVVKILFISREEGIMSYLIDSLQLPTVVVIMHSILYINLVTFYMEQMSCVIQKRYVCQICGMQKHLNWNKQCRRNMCDLIQLTTIKRLKLVYYRLSRITNEINDYFGLSLGAAILRNFVDVSFSCYWGYTILVTKRPKITLIGPIACFFESIITTTILINAIQNLYDQVTPSHLPLIITSMLSNSYLIITHMKHFTFQKTFQVVKNMEKHYFSAGRSTRLCLLKQDFLTQIHNNPIVLSVKGFSKINRELLTAVS